MTMEFEGIENARELGGLVRTDGARIKEGLLLRTGKLSQATEGDIKQLADMGLSAVIDFRDLIEIQRDPDREVPGAVHYHLPALADLGEVFGKAVNDETLTAEETHAGFGLLYRSLALSPKSHEAYTRFFEILLQSEGKPVLFHCTQGKDRTGVAGMLLLTALGFDEETAVREYMLTNGCMQRQLDGLTQRDIPAEKLAIAREVLLVFEENARSYLQNIRIEYGSAINFLELVMGIGPEEIATLERFYLE